MPGKFFEGIKIFPFPTSHLIFRPLWIKTLAAHAGNKNLYGSRKGDEEVENYKNTYIRAPPFQALPEAVLKVSRIHGVEREKDMKMSNACEVIEKLARESEDRKILEILQGCKELNEAIEKVRELIAK